MNFSGERKNKSDAENGQSATIYGTRKLQSIKNVFLVYKKKKATGLML